MNANTVNVLLFTASAVAKSVGVEIYHLRDLEPPEFGSPGHWRMVGGQPVYTERGVELLIETLTRAGKLTQAAGLYALLVEERQRREVPSRALPVGDKARPYYLTHPTLA